MSSCLEAVFSISPVAVVSLAGKYNLSSSIESAVASLSIVPILMTSSTVSMAFDILNFSFPFCRVLDLIEPLPTSRCCIKNSFVVK